MQAFSIREPRYRSGELSREAESGKLSLITRRGRPLLVGVPFARAIVAAGVHTALALHLFKAGQLSLGAAAGVAQMPRAQFIELLGGLGIAIVNYPPSDLHDELAQM